MSVGYATQPLTSTMITQLIDRFCESQRRWLIVTGVTFVVGLLTGLPQVDVLLTQRDEQKNLEEELVRASRSSSRLATFKERAATETAALEQLEQRTVDEQRLPEFRTALVDIVRESGCQMRRINVAAVRSRPWKQGDNPVTEVENRKAKSTPFTLETRSVSLSVSGSTQSVRSLLTRVQDEQKIFHAKTMDLRPLGRNRRGVQMDLELWYFALTRGPRA